jgi:hypothetical protein
MVWCKKKGPELAPQGTKFPCHVGMNKLILEARHKMVELVHAIGAAQN